MGTTLKLTVDSNAFYMVLICVHVCVTRQTSFCRTLGTNAVNRDYKCKKCGFFKTSFGAARRSLRMRVAYTSQKHKSASNLRIAWREMRPHGAPVERSASALMYSGQRNGQPSKECYKPTKHIYEIPSNVRFCWLI